jgi:hypothetical protein
MNNVLKFSALALAAVLLLKKHNRLLTKLTSVLCACWTKLAASNNPSGLLSSRPIFWVGFFIAWRFSRQ